MTFQDFLDRCDSQLRKFNAMCDEFPSLRRFPDMKESQIFYLGDDEKVSSDIKDLREDLQEEVTTGIPMPFDDISCVSKLQGKWIYDRIIKVKKGTLASMGLGSKIEATPKRKGLAEPEEFFVLRHEEISNIGFQWPILFVGVNQESGEMSVGVYDEWFETYPLLSDRGRRKLDTVAHTNSGEILWDVAYISHPQNYIVRTTPPLSPRETRRVAGGKRYPASKLPHFVVVDHDVLVDMSQRKSDGTGHASPVPHHRRGHWMRLAERCRHAKLLGRDKVFVRPTYVGDRTFSDGRNLYEVVMDIKQEPASVLKG